MGPDLGSLAGATIAFDLDGTLVDTAPDLVGTLNVLLAQEGLAPLPVEHAQPLIGYGARRLIERGFQAAGAPLEDQYLQALFERFIPLYEARIADESRPFPGVVRALEALKAAGANLAVCTNKRTGMSKLLLDALDMSRLFDAIVGPDAAGCAKPDPRHLIFAVEAAGGAIERAIMVGDAATDAGAARAARAPLILVSFGYTDIPVRDLEPDMLIDHFDELPGACARLLAACGASALTL
jgi:phosphoglycolate phosphatase